MSRVFNVGPSLRLTGRILLQIRALGSRQQLNSLFAVVVVQCVAPEQAAFGGAHAPLPAVGIIDRLANRIVRHYVENQILRAVINPNSDLGKRVAMREGLMA